MHATGMDGLRSTLDMVQSLQTQQRMLAKPFQNILSDMAKISEVSHTCCAHLLEVFRQMDEASRAFRANLSEIFRQIESVRVFQSNLSGMLSNVIPNIYEALHNNTVQELANLQIKILKDIESFSLDVPEIKIVGDRVWIDNEEIIPEDFDKIVGLDFHKIDAVFWKKWDKLPRTLQNLVLFIISIVIAFLPSIVSQNSGTQQLDRLQFMDMIHEAIRSIPSDSSALNSETMVDCLPLVVPVDESANDTMTLDAQAEDVCSD